MTESELRPFRLFLDREGIDVTQPDATATDLRNAGRLLADRLYMTETRGHAIVAALAEGV